MLEKAENEPDPTFKALVDEEQSFGDKLAWRKLAKPMVCPHLWKGTLGKVEAKGTYRIHVRATNPNGQILDGERIIRVE